MANPNLFIYKILNNVDARITITGLSKDVIAYTTQDFGFSASAQWSGRNPNSFLNLANTIEQLGVEGMNRLFGKRWGELSAGQTLDIAGSMLNYQGTEPFGFTLNMYFVAMRENDDVRDKITVLAEGLFPTFGGTFGGLQRIHPPNKYKKGANINTVDGALKIEIGRWFRTSKLFVIENMDFNVSKETVPGGRPLFANGTVKFRSVRVLSIDEVKQMFRLK